MVDRLATKCGPLELANPVLAASGTFGYGDAFERFWPLETLGGFVTTTVGKIPATGTSFEHGGVKYTVIDAEPQKVNRVRIEMTPQPATEEAPQPTT